MNAPLKYRPAVLTELIASLESGARPKGGASAETGDILSLGAEHLTDEGGFSFDKPKRIPKTFFEQMRSGRISKDDILIVKDGATTGKTSFVGDDFPFSEAAINEHLFRVSIRTTIGCPRYIFHFLFSPAGKKQILNDFRGATVGGIGRGFSDKVIVPLPPIDEQRRIAAILDKADVLRRKRKSAAELLDNFAKSVFLETFGDCARNPKNWPTKGLLDLFDVKTGKLDSNAAVAGGQFPFFTCAREISWIDTYAFDCQALLLAGNNASGDYSVKHYGGKFNAYQRTYVMTLKDDRNYYSYFKLALESKLEEMKRHSKGTNTKYLTLKILEELRLPVPDLEAQQLFEKASIQIEIDRSRNKFQMEKMDSLFSSLQQEAFSGLL